jgi:hypothetical protein
MPILLQNGCKTCREGRWGASPTLPACCSSVDGVEHYEPLPAVAYSSARRSTAAFRLTGWAA